MKISDRIEALMLEGYIRALSRKLWQRDLLRWLPVAAVLSLVVATILAVFVRSQWSVTARIAALVLISIPLGIGLAIPVFRAAKYGDRRAIDELRKTQVRLASRLATAIELKKPPRGVSAELCAAYVERIEGELSAEVGTARKSSPIELAPSDRARALAATAASLVLLALGVHSDRVRSGWSALFGQATFDAQGAAIAGIVTHFEARIEYPEYTRRGPEHITMTDTTELRVLENATVHFSIRVTKAAATGSLSVGDRAIPLRGRNGSLVGSLRVSESGPITIVARDSQGQRWTDAAKRSLRALPDALPRVRIVEPARDMRVEAGDRVKVGWKAEDDFGLQNVEMVIQVSGGAERRSRLRAFVDSNPEREAQGEMQVDLAELDARNGDRITVRIEAADENARSRGVSKGSALRTLHVGVEPEDAARQLELLDALLDRGLVALAARLEQEWPEQGDFALSARRARAVREPSHAFLLAIVEAKKMRDESLAEKLSSIETRLEDKEREEDAAIRGLSTPRLRAADEAFVTELENISLELDDLRAAARIADALSTAREIEALREEMRSLLEEFRQAQSEAARNAILDAIGRARARMRELAEKLSQLGEDVPSEFVNPAQERRESMGSALDQAENAAREGDFENLETEIEKLGQELDRMSQLLADSDARFRLERSNSSQASEERARALDELRGIEAEQGALAQRTGGLQRRLSQMAAEEAQRGGGPGQGLSGGVAQVRQAMQNVHRERLLGGDRETYDSVLQRLSDVEDTLQTGDLAEAREMAERAKWEMESLAGELDLSRRMFPGASGETSRESEAANQALQRLEELSQRIARAMPDLSRHLDDAARRQMAQNAGEQDRVREALDRWNAEHPEFRNAQAGTSNEARGAQGDIERARERMDESEARLRQGRLNEARSSQAAALSELQALRQAMERNQNGNSGGQSGDSTRSSEEASGEPSDAQSSGEEREGGEGVSPRDRVEIPAQAQGTGPQERRRRILRAMERPAPRGFEQATRRYYEELLR